MIVLDPKHVQTPLAHVRLEDNGPAVAVLLFRAVPPHLLGQDINVNAGIHRHRRAQGRTIVRQAGRDGEVVAEPEDHLRISLMTKPWTLALMIARSDPDVAMMIDNNAAAVKSA